MSMFGKIKKFAINNTGTKIQAVLGQLNKEDRITIEKINTVDLERRRGLREHDSNTNMMSDEESFSADEIIKTNGKGEGHQEKGIDPILFETFSDIEDKQLDLGVNIPSRFIKSIFIDKDFSESNPKDKNKEVKKEINIRLERPVSSDHYDFIDTAENRIIGFTYEGRPPFLNIYDQIQDLLDIKTKIQLLLPDELALANLIKYNYEPEPDEIIAIVHITTEYSQLIITKGGDLLQVSHVINIPAKSPDILNKISGRLLYEKDLNNIDSFSRIVITGMDKNKNAAETLKEKASFESPVEYFNLSEEKFAVMTEELGDAHKISVPLGILVTLLTEQKPHINTVDLVPEYIKDRQTLLKATWYNILILFLLFLAPIYLGYRYNQEARRLDNLKEDIRILEQKIAALQPIKEKRNRLMVQLNKITTELDNINNISQGNYQLSKSLDKIKSAMQEEGNFWLDDISFNRENIVLSGYSMYRNRPPRFVANFPDAKLEKITRDEIRGEPVYKFQIIINKVYDNPEIFNPKVEQKVTD